MEQIKKESAEFKEVLQENVQQQLVQVLNSKTTLLSNKNVNVIKTSLKTQDQRNVGSHDVGSGGDSLLLLAQKQLLPQATARSCEKIPVGNTNLSLQITQKEENMAAKTRTPSTKETEKTEEEKMVKTGSGNKKVKSMEEEESIAYGVDKWNVSSSKNTTLTAKRSDNQLKTAERIAASRGSGGHHDNNLTLNDNTKNRRIENVKSPSKQNVNVFANVILHNSDTGNYARTVSHHDPFTKTNEQHETTITSKMQSAKSLLDSAVDMPAAKSVNVTSQNNTSKPNNPNLTDRYLKTLARISAATNGKADLQTVLQRHQQKTENHLLHFPQSHRYD